MKRLICGSLILVSVALLPLALPAHDERAVTVREACRKHKQGTEYNLVRSALYGHRAQMDSIPRSTPAKDLLRASALVWYACNEEGIAAEYMTWLEEQPDNAYILLGWRGWPDD